MGFRFGNYQGKLSVFVSSSYGLSATLVARNLFVAHQPSLPLPEIGRVLTVDVAQPE